MNIKISSIADRGVPTKERVVLKVLADTDIGEYALFRTSVDAEGSVTTGVKGVFWFPDKPVAAGDFVVVYTKSGLQSEKLLGSGSTSHFFYWGLKEPLWKPMREAAVLLHIDSWVSLQVP